MRVKNLRRMVHRLFVTTLIVLLSGSNITAHRISQLTDKDLVAQSRLIVLGKVSGVMCEWNADHTQIYTNIDFELDSLIKGTLPSGTLSLRILGGTVGDTTLLITGSPTFIQGEEVLLFLAPNYLSPYPCVGMSQGKMTIEIDSTTGEKTVVGKNMVLNEYISQIKQIIRQQKGGKK